MSRRIYLEASLEVGETIRLDPENSHYLTRVMRLKAGDALRCFDGTGREHAARLANPNPRSCSIEIAQELRHSAEPPLKLHLAQGWLKGQAMDSVIQKATELGVTDIWPIEAMRSNVRIDAGRTARRLLHWRGIARSSTEQSERLFLPRLHEPRRLEAFVDHRPCQRLILLDPGAAALPGGLPFDSLALMVGPEGGWTEHERQMAEAAGADRCGLGNLVLRAETAPIAALAAVRQSWGWR
jgi:16S rRNA (uracil1498-N3)-methyltransferase